MKGYLTILNFTTEEILIFPYDDTEWEDVIEFIEAQGLSSNNCQWMESEQLIIKIK